MPDRLLLGAAILVIAGFLALGGWFARPQPADAGVVGSIILVTTTADTEADDGQCSLREAIIAANLNGIADTCGPGTGPDSIRFSLGSGNPVINITSDLPQITEQVTIAGNTGGATRVVLHGPGQLSDFGIDVGVGASNTVVRHLVINNFFVGIRSSATNVSVRSNYIGTDATGMLAQGNLGGVSSAGTGLVIGGTNGTTPGGACTGDCNVISASSGAGVVAQAGTSPVVQGNFIGTNALGGGVGMGNHYGIDAPGAMIGGDTAAARNIISGSETQGIRASGGTIKGNYIGVNSSGTEAIPNLEGGIILLHSNFATYILENVISGNGGFGIQIYDSSEVRVFGNRIGTAADGVSPVPNFSTSNDQGHGVDIRTGAQNNFIGSPLSGEPNTIAFNSGDGVRVFEATTILNFIRGNSIHSNSGLGINNLAGGNVELLPPAITQVTAGSVSGTGCVFPCIIDIFADAANEGRVYLGSAAADNGGLWTFNGTIQGPSVTATDTDPTIGTSEFSAPFAAAFGLQGDVDCSGSVNAVDALKLLRANTALPVAQNEPCVDIGTPTAGGPFGDVDCSTAVNAVDALKVLRHNTGLSVAQTEPCTNIGQTLGS